MTSAPPAPLSIMKICGAPPGAPEKVAATCGTFETMSSGFQRHAAGATNVDGSWRYTSSPRGDTSNTALLKTSKPTMPATVSALPDTIPPTSISMNTGRSTVIGPNRSFFALRKRQGTFPATPLTKTSPNARSFKRDAAL